MNKISVKPAVYFTAVCPWCYGRVGAEWTILEQLLGHLHVFVSSNDHWRFSFIRGVERKRDRRNRTQYENTTRKRKAAFVLFPRSVTISQTLTPSPLHLSPHWQWPVTTVLARRQTRQLRLAAHCTHCTVTRLHPSPLPTTSSPPPYSPYPSPPFPWHHMHCLMQWSMCWLFVVIF